MKPSLVHLGGLNLVFRIGSPLKTQEPVKREELFLIRLKICFLLITDYRILNTEYRILQSAQLVLIPIKSSTSVTLRHIIPARIIEPPPSITA